MKIQVFWDIIPSRLVNFYSCFEGQYCLHCQGKLVQEAYSWTARHWWWRHGSPSKRQELFVSLHGITFQKTCIFILDTQIRQFIVTVWPGQIHFRLLWCDLLVQLFCWLLVHTPAAMLKWSSILSFWADCERSKSSYHWKPKCSCKVLLPWLACTCKQLFPLECDYFLIGGQIFNRYMWHLRICTDVLKAAYCWQFFSLFRSNTNIIKL
jgi:hypothetical protein